VCFGGVVSAAWNTNVLSAPVHGASSKYELPRRKPQVVVFPADHMELAPCAKPRRQDQDAATEKNQPSSPA